MAIFGIGAQLGKTDMLEIFLANNIACLGWDRKQAPALHALMRKIQPGDIVFAKGFSQSFGLYVKAIGIAVNTHIRPYPDEKAEYGYGIEVRWIWKPVRAYHVGRLQDNSDFVRKGSVYEELNPFLIRRIISMLVRDIEKPYEDEVQNTLTAPNMESRGMGHVVASAGPDDFESESPGKSDDEEVDITDIIDEAGDKVELEKIIMEYQLKTPDGWENMDFRAARHALLDSLNESTDEDLPAA